jgi:hypothetical protein
MEGLRRAERLTPEKVELKIRRLNRRTYGTLEALHYLEQNGRILCLDFAIAADSEEALDALALAEIDHHHYDRIPKPAHADFWRAFVVGEPVSERLLPTRLGRPLRVTLVRHA